MTVAMALYHLSWILESLGRCTYPKICTVLPLLMFLLSQSFLSLSDLT